MRVFKDLDLVEQLGTGIIRILKSYDKDVYEFSDNFIRVNFNFKSPESLANIPKAVTSNVNHLLSETQEKIIELIDKDNRVTQDEMKTKLGVNVTTISRNLRDLKERNLIKRVGSNKNGKWIIL